MKESLLIIISSLGKISFEKANIKHTKKILETSIIAKNMKQLLKPKPLKRNQTKSGKSQRKQTSLPG
jgi:hypothetical protein